MKKTGKDDEGDGGSTCVRVRGRERSASATLPPIPPYKRGIKRHKWWQDGVSAEEEVEKDEDEDEINTWI